MDGERLVEAVRKYEILYVSSQKSYKSNEKKAEAWLKVSEEVEIPGNYFICYVFLTTFSATTQCSLYDIAVTEP